MLTLALALLAAACPVPLPERQLLTDTREVVDLLIDGDQLWAATTGGVERYDLHSLQRQRVYTTEDGLPTLAAHDLALVDGRLAVGLEGARCLLVDDRFLCASEPAAAAAPRSTSQPVEGARATKTLQFEGRTIAGTAGRGIWLDGRLPITPRDQICSNHIVAIAEWSGRTWFGSFDNGLCSYDGAHFADAALASRLINDLAATPDGLFVATADGLFHTVDGQRFDRVASVDRAINDLAYDHGQRVLYATNPALLYRLPLARSRVKPRQFWLPGGSRSLQAVAARNGDVWLASEDRGALHLVRGRFRVHDRTAGLPSSWALDVAIGDDGTAYVATLRHGVVRIRGNLATALPQWSDPWTLFVGVDRGAIWIGTQHGAALVAGNQVRSIGPLAQPCAHVVAAIGDRIWIGTEQGLLVVTEERT